MRLNSDCARLVMLYLEENLQYSQSISGEELAEIPIFTSFEHDDVLYAVKQLCKEGYLEFSSSDRIRGGALYRVKDVEPKGHKFCELVRKEDEWNKSKPLLENLSTIESITAVLSNLISVVGTFLG